MRPGSMAQVLVFAFVNLLAYAALFGMLALPLALLRRLGMNLGAHGRWLRWALPALALGALAGWTVASYRAFQEECRTAAPMEIFAARDRATGLELTGYDRELPGGRFNATALIESGVVGFVDDRGTRRCLTFDENSQPPRALLTSHCPHLQGSKAGIALQFAEPARIDRWWLPPVYRDAMEVRDTATGTVLARASDVVFGGGLFGFYLRAYNGDQDFTHLSCGYASADIGPLRPTLLGRPRMAQYRAADLRLIAGAVHGARGVGPALRQAP